MLFISNLIIIRNFILANIWSSTLKLIIHFYWIRSWVDHVLGIEKVRLIIKTNIKRFLCFFILNSFMMIYRAWSTLLIIILGWILFNLFWCFRVFPNLRFFPVLFLQMTRTFVSIFRILYFYRLKITMLIKILCQLLLAIVVYGMNNLLLQILNWFILTDFILSYILLLLCYYITFKVFVSSNVFTFMI